MGHHVVDSVRAFVLDYGYWAIALALLCENAGIPVPGETTLLLASFLAYSEHKLHLGWIIVVATCAATLGDNLGYILGHYGGRPLLDRYQNFFRVRQDVLERGEALFERYGAAAVFFARFIFGLRILAGPLAGVLRMHWRDFALFNFLGATLWVSMIATAGFLFGRHWHTLLRVVERFNLGFLAVAISILLYIWYRRRNPDLHR